MNQKKFTKLLALYLPYLLIGLVATNLGEAWRLAEGKELGDKIVSLMGTLPVAFANPLPSLHPLDLLIGIHRFGNGIGFLACLFSLEQGHHVSITTLNVYSGDTTQKISPSFSVYDFSFSIGFPSAR